MARNSYSAYRSAGSSAGQYKASLYEAESSQDKMAFADKRGAWEEEKLSRKVETIGAGLELASTIYGGVQDKKKFEGRVEAMETKYGGLQADTRDWKKKGYDYLTGKERQYTFGEGDASKTFSKAGIGATGGALLGESMLDEAGLGISRNETPVDDLSPSAGIDDKTLLSSEETGENLLEATSEYKQGEGLTEQANTKLYEADPSMEGKSAAERVKKYEELFGGGGEDESGYDRMTFKNIMDIDYGNTGK